MCGFVSEAYLSVAIMELRFCLRGVLEFSFYQALHKLVYLLEYL